MIRGTTPTHIFVLPEEMKDATFNALYITYQQRRKTVLEKTLDDVQRDGTTALEGRNDYSNRLQIHRRK